MSKRKKSISRRTFLALTGGSGAGLMLNQGEKYVHKIIPYVNPPKYPPVGSWAFYTTACRECPAGCGMLTWHRDGRSTKAEGNPDNPINKGKLCIRGQSSVQGQYDPDRLKDVLKKNGENEFTKHTWEEALDDIQDSLDNLNVVVISDLQTGSLAGVMEDFATAHKGKVHYYEAFNYENIRKANDEMYGYDLVPYYNIKDSDLIISFGADFLETWLSPVEYARDFIETRDYDKGKDGRFIYFGSHETLTAANADDFVVTEPGTEAETIMQLISILKKKGRITGTAFDGRVNEVRNKNIDTARLEVIADHIAKAKDPVVLAGKPGRSSRQGIDLVKAANHLNELLGSRHRIDFGRPHSVSKTLGMKENLQLLRSLGKRHLLIIHKTNPVYSIPGSEEFIQKAGKVVFIGNMHNETAAYANWILPAHYPLEDIGDYEAWKGLTTLMQPTMSPLFNTKSSGSIFLEMNRFSEEKDYYRLVRNNWKKWLQGMGSSDRAKNEQEQEQLNPANEDFSELMQKGFLQRQTEEITPGIRSARLNITKLPSPGEKSFYLEVNPSLLLYDGRLSNRPWLQEIPHPLHGIVWQSWLNIHPEKAAELNIKEKDALVVSTLQGDVEIPVWFTEKINKNTVSIEAGQGHWSLGEVANGTGVNAFSLIPQTTGTATVLTFKNIVSGEKPLSLIGSPEQYDRELLQHVGLKELKSGTATESEITWPTPKGYKKDRDLYDPHEHVNHRWAMVIDLNRCIGCKSCEAACYAENNIPVLGRENMKEGREMSWLKVIPYLIEKDKHAFLPLPCQHCDAAPCEPVCPVYAAVHTEEGLNAQIYNRCIGTRYCSNNCPYKVRRFNWTNVEHNFPANLQLNPEVTVRERGVMEKCTFCVQRIRNKEYEAKKEKRDIRDQEIRPACQQTCPTNAITFGDLHNEDAEILKLMENKRRYQLLHEFNTKPGVIYLKKVINSENNHNA